MFRPLQPISETEENNDDAPRMLDDTDVEENVICADWLHFFSTGAYVRLDYQRNMADAEVQRSIGWLVKQKSDLEESSFGANRQSVLDAVDDHSQKRKIISEYRNEMDKLSVKHTLTPEETHDIYGSYQSLQTLAEKRTGCFEILSGIAELESQIQTLSTGFDNKAVHLVKMADNNRQENGHGLSNDSMAKTAQNCISAVRQNWKWADEVMQCAHVHLANAAAYHEFFHDVDEVEYWMNNIMSKMHHTFNRQNLNGDSVDLNDINKEMRDTLMAYLRWQTKVDNVCTRARNIVPVDKRTSPIQEPRPVMALTNYSTAEIQFSEGDTLTLLDNSDASKWKVENLRHQTATVPAVILLITAPSGQAIDAAMRLRLQLLGLWTASVKRLGYQLIAFMQLVLKDWSEDEIKAIQRMPKENRTDLLRILTTLEQTTLANWNGYDGYDQLHEKICRLRRILEEAEDVKPGAVDPACGNVVVQVTMLEDILHRYQDFWTYWETYKVTAELIRQPKYLLVCDKWEQLRYMTSAHFVRFWDTNLQMPGGKRCKAEAAITLHETPKTALVRPISAEVSDLMASERIEKTPSAVLESMQMLSREDYMEDEFASKHMTATRRHESTKTDEVLSSFEEVQHTFVIRSVTDPRNNKELTLHEAIVAGIVDNVDMKYINPRTGKSVSLQEAMANGDITVQFKSQKKVKEEQSSYGIISVTTIKETRPYTIMSVTDPKTDEQISVAASQTRGILSPDASTYTTEKGETMDLLDAIHSGLVKAEFHGDETESEEEECKTYAVSDVIDQKLGTRIPFHEAITKGIIDTDTGTYFNNKTKLPCSVNEAIMKGFIKARVVTDPSSMDIDPRKTVVVQSLVSMKEKLLKAVRANRGRKPTGGASQNGI